MPHELLKSEVQIIASSEYNFKVELILDIGREDIPDLIETSKCLVDIFGDRALLNKNNIYKYFSKDTLPFVARYKGVIIAFVIRKKFQGKSGYAKTLKRIYLNWAKKRNYKYISGHVASGICQTFKNTEVVKTFPKWYDAKSSFDYYRRTI